MALVDAVREVGRIPLDTASRAAKKRYSERLSHKLAEELADALRGAGFPSVKPAKGGPREREFQGGLGPKKVDVEKFENITLLLFEPVTEDPKTPIIRLIDGSTKREMPEQEYLASLRHIYNQRNPHDQLGDEDVS